MITSGVQALGADLLLQISKAVRNSKDFTEDNDPHHEHDFGAFDFQGHRLFFKIDYYDPTLTVGSENPADPKATCRVLTIMLATEY